MLHTAIACLAGLYFIPAVLSVVFIVHSREGLRHEYRRWAEESRLGHARALFRLALCLSAAPVAVFLYCLDGLMCASEMHFPAVAVENLHDGTVDGTSQPVAWIGSPTRRYGAGRPRDLILSRSAHE